MTRELEALPEVGKLAGCRRSDTSLRYRQSAQPGNISLPGTSMLRIHREPGPGRGLYSIDVTSLLSRRQRSGIVVVSGVVSGWVLPARDLAAGHGGAGEAGGAH